MPIDESVAPDRAKAANEADESPTTRGGVAELRSIYASSRCCALRVERKRIRGRLATFIGANARAASLSSPLRIGCPCLRDIIRVPLRESSSRRSSRDDHCTIASHRDRIYRRNGDWREARTSARVRARARTEGGTDLKCIYYSRSLRNLINLSENALVCSAHI